MRAGRPYPYTIDTLINRALGTEGYYGVFTANMHTDSHPSAGSNAIIASAQSNGVPVVSGRQLLNWLDGRNGSAFESLNWSTDTLSFTVSIGAGANGLQVMLPVQSAVGPLSGITMGGNPVTYAQETIKGITYAIFNAQAGAYVASYAPDTTPPVVNSVSPTDAATDVPTSSVVTATFNEPLDVATVNTDTFELRAPGDVMVPATVTYNAATNTATLTPDAALNLGASYSATVKGGASGMTDVAGNPLAADTTWSFSTVADNCPCSIWDDTATPASSPVNDSQPIEVGTKFRSDTTGYITSLRFYKGAGDTDTHVGHLWTAGGAQLAEVTFTNETASGWQEMELPTPVQIEADTTYITSVYSSPVGNFSITAGGLASAVDNPPLRALASGVEGPNGVYAYGGGFPSSGGDANYWVDVVFEYSVTEDTTPPVISNLNAAPAGDGTALITWDTDEPADSLVEFGITSGALNLSESNAALVTSHSITLTGLAPSTTYYYQVTSTDASTNSATSTEASFTTPAQTLGDTTVADFNAGTVGACYVDVGIGDGALRLPPALTEDFLGTSLPAGWTNYNWPSGSDPVVGGGLLTVNGTEAFTTAEFGPGQTLEFVATFNAQSYQHVGFGGTLVPDNGNYVPFNGSPWIMFSTSNDAAQLYARALPAGNTAYNTGNDKIPLGNYLGSPHTYRIDWKADSIDFYIDGELKTTVAATIATPMRVSASDYQSATPSLSVDWIRLSPPYASSCVFESRVFDAGDLVDWTGLTATTTTPTNTTIVLEVRTGNADGYWTTWQASTLVPLNNFGWPVPPVPGDPVHHG